MDALLEVEQRVVGREPGDLELGARVFAARLEAVMGEELAKAERRVRAKVDSLVDDKVEPVRRQVAEIQADARQRLAAEQKRLDDAEAELQAQLKRLTASLGPDLKLPKIKL